MENLNIVFIARSIDGYIADKNGGLDWLQTIPNPDQDDMGYNSLMDRIDALVMGRKTFETVCGFGIEWPYAKPVFVLSKTLNSVPEHLMGEVFLVKGPLAEILDEIHGKGYSNLYIDGGRTIQSFLREDLVDEMILTTIPVLLGGGSPLFGELSEHLEFEHEKSEVFLNAIVQDTFKRKS
jgi:dihydrofolate reductase